MKLICRIHFKDMARVKGIEFNSVDGVVSFEGGEAKTLDAIQKLNAIIKLGFKGDINIDVEKNEAEIANFLVNARFIDRIEVLKDEED